MANKDFHPHDNSPSASEAFRRAEVQVAPDTQQRRLDGLQASPWRPAKRVCPTKVERLTESLRLSGQRKPLLLDNEGRILDGLVRYAAMEKLGWEVAGVSVLTGSPEQLQAFVLEEELLGGTLFLSAEELETRWLQWVEVMEEVHGRPRQGRPRQGDTRSKFREEAAAMLGKSISTINKRLTTREKLHREVLAELDKGDLGREAALLMKAFEKERQMAFLRSLPDWRLETVKHAVERATGAAGALPHAEQAPRDAVVPNQEHGLRHASAAGALSDLHDDALGQLSSASEITAATSTGDVPASFNVLRVHIANAWAASRQLRGALDALAVPADAEDAEGHREQLEELARELDMTGDFCKEKSQEIWDGLGPKGLEMPS